MKKFSEFISLKESQESRKLVIYDFDGTLFKSPEPDEGTKNYESLTGKPWPFKGWWGRIETLMPPLVPQKPGSEWYYHNIVEKQHADSNNPFAKTVLMTGRHIGFKNRVLEILDNKKMAFDDTYFAGQTGSIGSGTFEIKSNNIRKLLSMNDYDLIEIYEDRPDHVREFAIFCQKLIDDGMVKKAKIHDVSSNKTIDV